MRSLKRRLAKLEQFLMHVRGSVSREVLLVDVQDAVATAVKRKFPEGMPSHVRLLIIKFL